MRACACVCVALGAGRGGAGRGGGECGYACGVWAETEERGTVTARPRTTQCVWGGGEGGSLWCVACAAGLGVCVCVWVDMCVCAVCRRGVCAGMRAMCRVPLRVWVWVWPVGARGHGGAETEAQRHS